MTVFTCGQLSDVAHTLGGNLHFQRELPGEQPVLDGEQQVQVLSDGLVLYFSQSRDLVDASSDNRLAPGITAAFLLGGEAEVSLPRQRLHFDARPGGQRAMLVNLTAADQFQRHWQSERQETKVCLSISPDWLQHFALGSQLRSDNLLRFSRSHWQSLLWQPSVDILQRAHQLLERDAGLPPLLQRLQRESFALDLASDILRGIDAPPGKRLGSHLERCLLRLRDWLDSGEANDLSIAEMARQLGTNPVDLQNAFRSRNGITIAAYLRKRRLEQAYHAICQQSLSIEDAASLAGYEHLSSFSAAFKRQYGFPPSQARH
ncbi:AraC family transcriptional regulator [Pseudomonas sp. PA1(2017)]|uniref:helix-turn-helix transcriptional regulator n=1 Tax=Pseudomonas sp. PA1(2017) TaxID=1932113 RepID=UPI00095B6488|nr:AraC family transcriptional regulator [Pseudomonas sp. PA1(2017)]OLU21098.1 AraC family transcriptional regulator [Pseudomonas sp. PA1(2017)]